MANNSQPVECVSFMYPPEKQIFLELRANYVMFYEMLDYLCHTRSDTHRSRGTTKLLQDMRKVAIKKAGTLPDAFQIAAQIGETYLELMKALQTKADPISRHKLDRIRDLALEGVDFTKSAKQAMHDFWMELGSTIGRITMIEMSRGKMRVSKTSSFATDNIQYIMLLFGTIEVCSEMLQQCSDYFSAMAGRTPTGDSLQSYPLSEEEIQMMQEKWRMFSDVTYKAYLEWEVVDHAVQALNDRRSPAKISFWRRVFKLPTWLS